MSMYGRGRPELFAPNNWIDSSVSAAEFDGMLDYAWRNGYEIVLPAGRIKIGGGTIGQAGSYKSCKITGRSFSGHYTDPDGYGSILQLADNTNGSMFEVAASDADDVGPSPFQLENLLIDMNRANQSGTGYAVNFLNHTASSNKQRSGFFKKVYIRDVQTSGVRVGVLRNAGVMEQVCILQCGTSGVGSAMQFASCNDWELYGCKFGVTEGPVVTDSGAGSLYAVACAFFVGGTHGWKADTASLDHTFIGCSFDTNDEHGVLIDTSSDYPWCFAGCRYNQNSFAADNTSSDFKIGANNTNVTVVGGNFFPGSTNNVKYVFDITAGGAVTYIGAEPKADHYGTAFTNNAAAVNGLYGAKPTITGARDDGTALADLLTKLAARGILVDGTTAS